MTREHRSSRISGFYKKPVEERIRLVSEFAGLSDEDVSLLRSGGGLSLDIADRMIENVLGLMAYPFAVAVNFRINGRDYMVPMVLEEPSVVAAASNMARLMREGDGIKASCTDPVMIGQIQVVDIPDMEEAMEAVRGEKDRILELANEQDPILVKLGGGAKDLELRRLETERGEMLILHLLVDCRDAMGANAVNTMCEAVAPLIEDLTGGRVLLRILTNLAVERLAWAEAVFDREAIGGGEVVDAVLKAYAFASADPYRAATHNKGVMNGVVAVALATGNDTRALEAGAHAYAARSGRYQPLTTWWRTEEGHLAGRIELPMAVGVVGGATTVHPVAKVARKILGVTSAVELAQVMASVGLAQNLAALRALATEGIQRGHMKLHARSLAMAAGAPRQLVDQVARQMVEEGNVSYERARQIVAQLASQVKTDM